jgi:hypothetical protein
MSSAPAQDQSWHPQLTKESRQGRTHNKAVCIDLNQHTKGLKVVDPIVSDSLFSADARHCRGLSPATSPVPNVFENLQCPNCLHREKDLESHKDTETIQKLDGPWA